MERTASRMKHMFNRFIAPATEPYIPPHLFRHTEKPTIANLCQIIQEVPTINCLLITTYNRHKIYGPFRLEAHLYSDHNFKKQFRLLLSIYP